MRSPNIIVEIIPLTPQIIDKEAQLGFERAFNGDGTCSAENIALSCFAGEACAECQSGKNLAVPRLSRIATFPIAYLARDLLTGSFLGCATGEEKTEAGSRSIYVSNLCVAHESRGLGVGRKILDRIRSDHSPQSIVVFTKNNLLNDVGQFESDVVREYQMRLCGQHAFYTRYGFVPFANPDPRYNKYVLHCP